MSMKYSPSGELLHRKMHTVAIRFFGREIVLACDGRCRKAWGVNLRPKVQLSDDEDDFAWLSDSELGDAPEDPGSYEGGQGKPASVDQRDGHLKWCARSCERSALLELDEPVRLPDFSSRIYNLGEPT